MKVVIMESESERRSRSSEQVKGDDKGASKEVSCHHGSHLFIRHKKVKVVSMESESKGKSKRSEQVKGDDKEAG